MILKISFSQLPMFHIKKKVYEKTKEASDSKKSGTIVSFIKCAECLTRRDICMLSVHVIRLSVALTINLENCMLKLVRGNVKRTKARLS